MMQRWTDVILYAFIVLVSLLYCVGLGAVAENVDNNNSNNNKLEEYKPNNWYRRYSQYPEYCSTPEVMEYRKVPKLADHNPGIGETRLLHVTAVVRHGARTPWSPRETCWDGYWQNPDTAIWNCDLTTVMAPPSTLVIEKEEGEQTQEGEQAFETDWVPDGAFFLFEKEYDALLGSGLTNELNGTCQVGQLLLQGYEQEIQNGRSLREAYAYKYEDYEHDERMRLIDLSFKTYNPWDPYHLKYRADDDQRTLMSGQVLLRGLFDEEVRHQFYKEGTYPHIPVHTADRERDILDANELVCPRLKTIKAAAIQSVEYQAFNNSYMVNQLRDYIKKHLGHSDPTKILDCLMTTICTDRPLPESVNDYGKPDSKFQSLAEIDIQSYNLIMKYNNSAYAKLSMGPLWAEMMENIEPWLDSVNYKDIHATKFALFSGHDTTIMPLLASLGPKLWNNTDWPPYASMLLIEIHELIDGRSNKDVFTTDFAFRLIFNGKILTKFVEGCPPEGELCDIVHFRKQVDPIATRNPDCSVPEQVTPNEVVVEAKQLISTREGILLLLGLVILSSLIGALATFVILTGILPCTRKKVLSNVIEEDEDARRGLQEVAFEDEPTSDEDFVHA